jgi:hypothetical protein
MLIGARQSRLFWRTLHRQTNQFALQIAKPSQVLRSNGASSKWQNDILTNWPRKMNFLKGPTLAERANQTTGRVALNQEDLLKSSEHFDYLKISG